MLLGNTSKKMLDKVTSMYRMPLMQCLRRTKQVIKCRLPGISTTFKRLPSAWSLLQSVFGFHLLLFFALPIKYSNHHFLNHWPPIQTYRHNMPRSIPDHSIRISIDRVSSSNRAFFKSLNIRDTDSVDQIGRDLHRRPCIYSSCQPQPNP